MRHGFCCHYGAAAATTLRPCFLSTRNSPQRDSKEVEVRLRKWRQLFESSEATKKGGRGALTRSRACVPRSPGTRSAGRAVRQRSHQASTQQHRTAIDKQYKNVRKTWHTVEPSLLGKHTRTGSCKRIRCWCSSAAMQGEAVPAECSRPSKSLAQSHRRVHPRSFQQRA